MPNVSSLLGSHHSIQHHICRCLLTIFQSTYSFTLQLYQFLRFYISSNTIESKLTSLIFPSKCSGISAGSSFDRNVILRFSSHRRLLCCQQLLHMRIQPVFIKNGFVHILTACDEPKTVLRPTRAVERLDHVPFCAWIKECQLIAHWQWPIPWDPDLKCWHVKFEGRRAGVIAVDEVGAQLDIQAWSGLDRRIGFLGRRNSRGDLAEQGARWQCHQWAGTWGVWCTFDNLKRLGMTGLLPGRDEFRHDDVFYRTISMIWSYGARISLKYFCQRGMRELRYLDVETWCNFRIQTNWTDGGRDDLVFISQGSTQINCSKTRKEMTHLVRCPKPGRDNEIF